MLDGLNEIEIRELKEGLDKLPPFLFVYFIEERRRAPIIVS